MTTTSAAPPYVVRRIGPLDRVGLCQFYAELSPDSRAERFHGATPPIPDRAARVFCGPDHRHREGIVAETTDADGARSIIGHVCIEPITADEAEMAIAVADAWQRQGVGRAMLAEAIRWALAHRVVRLRASVRWGNAAVLGLLRSCGFALAFGPADGGGADVIIDLRHATVPAAA